MKKMEFSQMENLQGGTTWGCSFALLTLGVSTAAIIAAGPGGALLAGGFALGAWGNAVEACSDLD